MQLLEPRCAEKVIMAPHGVSSEIEHKAYRSPERRFLETDPSLSPLSLRAHLEGHHVAPRQLGPRHSCFSPPEGDLSFRRRPVATTPFQTTLEVPTS